MEIIGHCRFSWLGISDTGRELLERDDGKQILWDPIRMAIRFYLFESIMLPSIRAQSDQNFRFILLISDDLPEIYQSRLETIVSPDTNIEIYRTELRDIGSALKPVMQASVSGGKQAVHFRLDDDDALCSSYISRLRSIVDSHNLEEATAISFPRGVYGFIHEGEGKHAEIFKSFNAIGLAFVNGETYMRNPFQVQHRQVGRRMKSFVDPTVIAFQNTLHLANNTAGYGEEISARQTASKGSPRIIRNHPHLATGLSVDPDLEPQIDAAFPATSGALLRSILTKSTNGHGLAQAFGFV